MNAFTIRLSIAFVLALVMTIVPLPQFLTGIRPPWVLLLILYVQFSLPESFNLGVLFLVGLVLDALLATVLGEHAFALTLVAWITSSRARRFNFFSIGQQMALVGFFCLIYQLIIFSIDVFLGYYPSLFNVLGSTLASIVLWPWIRLLTDETLLVRTLRAQNRQTIE